MNVWELVGYTPAGTIDVGGNLTIESQDNAVIKSNSEIEISSVVTNNVDGFLALAIELVDRDYLYTTNSGEQILIFGDQIRVAADFTDDVSLQGVVFAFVGGLFGIETSEDFLDLSNDDFLASIETLGTLPTIDLGTLIAFTLKAAATGSGSPVRPLSRTSSPTSAIWPIRTPEPLAASSS